MTIRIDIDLNKKEIIIDLNGIKYENDNEYSECEKCDMTNEHGQCRLNQAINSSASGAVLCVTQDSFSVFRTFRNSNSRLYDIANNEMLTCRLICDYIAKGKSIIFKKV